VSNPYPPQQPQQPGWGQQPPTQQWQPPPPKKSNAGKIVGFGCLGLVGLFVLLGIVGAIIGSGDSSDDSKGSAVAASSPAADEPAPADTPKSDDKPAEEAKASDKPKAKVVTFKVWGTAPAGALGPLDITYGSDSDNRKGSFKDGKFEATLPLNEDAMYFNVMAQLQGSGDINCSVTVDGETKKGHASGGYNICNAQLSSGLLGGWD
jgi:hypothetical protein